LDIPPSIRKENTIRIFERMQTALLVPVLAFGLAAADAKAQEAHEYIEVEARIVSVSPDTPSITVEYDGTDARQTLMLSEDTHLRLEGRFYTIRDAKLGWLEPGDDITLGYVERDEIETAMSVERHRTADHSDATIVERHARVVSVSPEDRTLTVQFDWTETRETLHLTERTQLRMEGRFYTIQDADLGWLEPADDITLGYLDLADGKDILSLEHGSETEH